MNHLFEVKREMGFHIAVDDFGKEMEVIGILNVANPGLSSRSPALVQVIAKFIGDYRRKKYMD